MNKYFFAVDEDIDHEFRQVQGRLKLTPQNTFVRIVRVAAYFLEAEEQGKKVFVKNQKGRAVRFHCRKVYEERSKKKTDIQYSFDGDKELDSRLRKIREILKTSLQKAFTGLVRMISRLLEAEVQKKKIFIKGGPDDQIIDFEFLGK